MNKIEQMYVLRRKHDGLYYCGNVVLPTNDLGSAIWSTNPLRIPLDHHFTKLAIMDPSNYELISIEHIYAIQRRGDNYYYCGHDTPLGDMYAPIEAISSIDDVCFLPFYHGSIYLAKLYPNIYRIVIKPDVQIELNAALELR
jgi:hypothetical protein